MSNNAVESPNHYCLYENVEVIDIIKAALTAEEFTGYCKGNIIKYRMRAGLKGTAEQDIKKSYEYKNYLENGTKTEQRTAESMKKLIDTITTPYMFPGKLDESLEGKKLSDKNKKAFVESMKMHKEIGPGRKSNDPERARTYITDDERDRT